MERFRTIVDWIRCRKDAVQPWLVGLTVVVLGGAAAWWAITARAEQKPSNSPSYPFSPGQSAGIERGQSPGAADRPESVADRRSIRDWVYPASQAVYESAQQTVRSPAPVGSRIPAEPIQAKEPGRPDEASEVKAYPCPPGKVGEIADALRTEFGPATGARISADERTSQVLVVASPAVQSKIARRLGDTQTAVVVPRRRDDRAATTPGDAGQPSRDAASPAEIQLRNKTAEQMEKELTGIPGKRFEPVSSPLGDVGRYRVTVEDGTAVEVWLDRRGHRVRVTGSGDVADDLRTLVRMLDAPRQSRDETTQVVPLTATRPADARRAVAAIRMGNEKRPGDQASRELAAVTPKPPIKEKTPVIEGAPAGEKPSAEAAKTVVPGTPAAADAAQAAQAVGLLGQVSVEILPGLDAIILRGPVRDVEMVKKIIDQIEEIAKKTEPEIQVYLLQHVDCTTMATLVYNVYASVYSQRQGDVYIVPLVRPNALLLVGRKENVERAKTLAQKLDSEAAPEAMVKVFFLKHATAATVQQEIQILYVQQAGAGGVGLGAAPLGAPGAAGVGAAAGGLPPQVRVTVDPRSNAVIVQASPRDMKEVEDLIHKLDIEEIPTVNQMRIYQLKHIQAATMQTILDTAIHGQGGAAAMGGTGAGGAGLGGGLGGGLAGGLGGAAGGMRTGTTMRSGQIEFVTFDERTREKMTWSSGILTDVMFTANPQNNTLMVSAPEKAMPLIEAVIQQMDRPPAVQAMIKVFSIKNGDAAWLVSVLNQFFGLSAAGGGAAAAGGAASVMPMVAAQAETSLVTLRFFYDYATNSIIAAGTPEDLKVVEAILVRLESSGDLTNRITKVYVLKNRPATVVGPEISAYLTSEGTIVSAGISSGLYTAGDYLAQATVVQYEQVSNALIVSASPKYFDKIDKLIAELDKRPPMVMIQVLLAQVTLTDLDEFGVEMGLQDSVLFNRSTIPAAGGVLTPGFAFPGAALGGGDVQSGIVGTQATSGLGVGRTNSTSGLGGLVLSASSEHVSLLIRALKQNHRLEVLSCPSVMTLDNQVAYIQVGEQLPYIGSSSLTTFGQTNTITWINSGVILNVVPRISPDGLVVMELQAQKSFPGPESEGTPISISTTGTVIRQPKIETTLAQTTVAAPDGQTVVLGGLISKSTDHTRTQVPLLGDIPLLGTLFRFDTTTVTRDELLIILTPHVIYNDEDMDAIKKTEAARMHWCLADVVELYGPGSGLRGRKDNWSDSETQVIYPDTQPGVPAPRPHTDGATNGTKAPTPSKAPVRLDVPPPPDRGSDSPTPSDQSNYPMAPPSSAGSLGGNRPGSAPAASISGRYDPRGSVTPVRYDRPEAVAVDDQNRRWGQTPPNAYPPEPARFAAEPVPYSSAPGRDPRQLPAQDQQPQPFTNPLRGEYQ